MRGNRREFLGALVGAGIYVHTRPAWSAEPEGFSILQGMTDATSSQFSLVLPKDTPWTIEVKRRGDSTARLGLRQEVVTRDFSPYAVYKVEVDGLELGPYYLLRVVDSSGRVRDEREFRALDLSPRPVRMALISCALDLFHSADVWDQFDAQNPEVVLFLGDNVYADRTSLINKRPADERQLWERYVLTRNRVAMYFQYRLRPVLATWDDHDYGADNGDRTFKHKDASHTIFETFFAQNPRASLLAGPGIARRFSAFGADFYFLDGRSFRDPAGGRAKLLGASQEEWLFENLQPRPSWLLSGSVFFGDYQNGESYAGKYGSDFSTLLARMRGSNSLACFASGDVHYSEIMEIEPAQLGYPTFELVSSSIHSYTFPGHEHRFNNPRRRASTSAHNFVIFEGEFSEDRIEGEATSYSANGREFQARVSATR